MEQIIIGTRKSQLAVAQSQLMADQLQQKFPDYQFKLKKITTKGDRILDKPLAEIGGKGLFIKEIEIALLNGEIDLAIHSLKDMPAELPNELEILSIPERANPLDALISKDDLDIDHLPEGAKIGTGSLRRRAQLLNYRSDLEIVPIRGNIDTRLKKLESQDLDGIILAAAGLERMGWEDKISSCLSDEISIPAVGQGALAIEVRANDQQIKDIVTEINHQATVDAVKAERSFLEYLEGDCKVPIGAYAQVEDDQLVVEGIVAKLDGSKVFKEEVVGLREEAVELGVKLAKKLLEQGAGDILEQVQKQEGVSVNGR
ncbi:hydroxymethylbilane synthase [Natroniella sp. ANB-PHB2]|uniref:hydroxymethylbilane synthase n=1 Tax=Natroniella sp. ANB-PHB2 TaxID=3384444 RepID=UPI0038D42903